LQQFPFQFELSLINMYNETLVGGPILTFCS